MKINEVPQKNQSEKPNNKTIFKSFLEKNNRLFLRINRLFLSVRHTKHKINRLRGRDG